MVSISRWVPGVIALICASTAIMLGVIASEAPTGGGFVRVYFVISAVVMLSLSFVSLRAALRRQASSRT